MWPSLNFVGCGSTWLLWQHFELSALTPISTESFAPMLASVAQRCSMWLCSNACGSPLHSSVRSFQLPSPHFRTTFEDLRSPSRVRVTTCSWWSLYLQRSDCEQHLILHQCHVAVPQLRRLWLNVASVATLRTVCVDTFPPKALHPCLHLWSNVVNVAMFERLWLTTALFCLRSFAEAISQQSFTKRLCLNVAQSSDLELHQRRLHRSSTQLFCASENA
jgi:hypothetical protein